MTEVKDGVQTMLISMNDIKHGVEVVRTTVINLDKALVPTVFVIEPAGSLKDSVVEQLKEGDVEAAEEEVMGMFDRFKSIFDAGSPLDGVQKAVDEFGDLAGEGRRHSAQSTTRIRRTRGRMRPDENFGSGDEQLISSVPRFASFLSTISLSVCAWCGVCMLYMWCGSVW